MPELVSHHNSFCLVTIYGYVYTQCLVLFAVYIRVHRKLLAGTKQVLLGQNVFPLTSLKPGEVMHMYLQHYS